VRQRSPLIRVCTSRSAKRFEKIAVTFLMMPPDPILRPDRPRPKQYRILPTTTKPPGLAPRRFSSPNSRHVFGDENRLPSKSSERSFPYQRPPEMSASKVNNKSGARDIRRPGSELTINVDRADQERARLDASMMTHFPSTSSSCTKLPPPSKPLLPNTRRTEKEHQPISPASTHPASIERSNEPQSRSSSCSLTPISSEASPPRASKQEEEETLSRSPDKPIYVFQSGRPKRRVTVEKEKKRLGGGSSHGSSGCSGSQSSGDGSQVKKQERTESKKEAGVERPKRVRIRDRAKERNRARELRRLKKLDKERRDKEEKEELRCKRREGHDSGSSPISAIALQPEIRVSVQPSSVRSSGLGRATRSTTRILPLSDMRTCRAVSTSATQSSSSPSPCISTRSQEYDLKLTSGVASGIDGSTGPEEIEAALIIGDLSRDARVRAITMESKTTSWNKPYGEDTKVSDWKRRDDAEGMKEVNRAWKTCERCGVS
jgi:hypothetical protein